MMLSSVGNASFTELQEGNDLDNILDVWLYLEFIRKNPHICF